MDGMAHPSVIDFKMGTHTVTFNCIKKGSLETVKKKDATTTTHSLGFRVSGLNFKDENGNLIRKMYRQYGKIVETDIPILIKEFLMTGGAKSPDSEAIKYFLVELRKMKTFMETLNTREMVGSSVLFVIDNTVRKWKCKIIDLACVTDREKEWRDHGFILGLSNLIKFF